MAGKKKTQRQLADEAYLRNQQVTIEQQIAEQAPSVRDYPKLDSIPDSCPECRAKWTDEYGVVPIVRPDQRQTVFLEQVQCGKCGNLFLVDSIDHETLRRARHARQEFLSSQRAPLPKKERRVRGAE